MHIVEFFVQAQTEPLAFFSFSIDSELLAHQVGFYQRDTHKFEYRDNMRKYDGMQIGDVRRAI